MSGAIALAFEGRQIRFHPEERSFRWLTGERGLAAVCGHGVRADMARAVLERAGHAVVRDRTPPRLTIHVDDEKWTASANGASATGDTFKSLAAHLRGLPPETREERES